jgi:hypothetical protein
MNELGLLFWFSDEQILKDMENVIRTIEFYIWGEKHTPAPLKRGRSIRKKSWFNFQNYYEDDSKFQLSKHKSPKRIAAEFPFGKQVQIICVLVLKRIDTSLI